MFLNKKFRISIIVPVYNTALYLHDCVNSIINQNYHSLEIILVDDGSRDSSPSMCDDYAAKYDYIKCIHKKNGGLSSARNAGIEQATGDCLLFLDSDDMLSLDALSTIENNMAGIDVLFFRWKTFSANNKEERISEKLFENQTEISITDMDFRTKLLKTDNMGSVCIKAFRTELIKTYNARFDETQKYGEDQLFCQQILPLAKNVRFIDDVLYLYRRDLQSLTGSFNPQKYQYLENIIFGLERISERWEISNKHSILAERYFENIKNDLILLFKYKNVNESQRKKYFRQIVNSSMCEKYISTYKPRKLINKIFHKFISWKSYTLVKLSCLIKGYLL